MDKVALNLFSFLKKGGSYRALQRHLTYQCSKRFQNGTAI